MSGMNVKPVGVQEAQSGGCVVPRAHGEGGGGAKTKIVWETGSKDRVYTSVCP